MPDAFHVLLLGVNALILSAGILAAVRSGRAARRALTSEVNAWCHQADARKSADEAKEHADRLNLPTVLPFPTQPAGGLKLCECDSDE